MLTFENFNAMIREIMDLGYDEATASRYAALIGCCPCHDAEGMVVVRDRRGRSWRAWTFTPRSATWGRIGGTRSSAESWLLAMMKRPPSRMLCGSATLPQWMQTDLSWSSFRRSRESPRPGSPQWMQTDLSWSRNVMAT
ncbi:hypothetical protein SBV1_1670015 [Verrucomicrobia bacterium]|nr:hypothetical protein SBV1_1670015 [Verrucomicrobiota bacterium]